MGFEAVWDFVPQFCEFEFMICGGVWYVVGFEIGIV